MILCDHSIETLIDNNTIGVEPKPDAEQIQPASLDVRVGEKYYDALVDQYVETADDEIRLHPHHPYLGTTVERIELPNDIAAQLTGRSSVGRKGVIIHKTAGWIDPGFRGKITLEMMNFGNETVTFDVGERVGQLVFFKLDGESRGYDGQYQDQNGISK
jgi:dCTP deaminase